jgi:hypothetical protein
VTGLLLDLVYELRKPAVGQATLGWRSRCVHSGRILGMGEMDSRTFDTGLRIGRQRLAKDLGQPRGEPFFVDGLVRRWAGERRVRAPTPARRRRTPGWLYCRRAPQARRAPGSARGPAGPWRSRPRPRYRSRPTPARRVRSAARFRAPRHGGESRRDGRSRARGIGPSRAIAREPRGTNPSPGRCDQPGSRRRPARSRCRGAG